MPMSSMTSRAAHLAALSLILACAGLNGCESDRAPGTADTDESDTVSSDVAADTFVADTVEPDVAPDTAMSDTAPPGCVPGSTYCESVQWLQLDAFPTGVDHHTTFIRTAASGATYLYVVGGVTSASGNITVQSNVRRAEIVGDFTLGPWADDSPLPGPLGFHGIAEGTAAVWIAAGISTNPDGEVTATNASYVGTFDAAGALSFAAGPDLPAEVRVHPTAHLVGDQLMVVGGSGPQQTPRDSTLLATVGTDNMPSAWVAGPPLPEPRSHHAAAVYQDRVWVFGGFTLDQVPLAGVLVSEHDASGVPVGWTEVGQMLDPPWTASATVYNNGILLIGGGQGGSGSEQYVDRVRYAAFTGTPETSGFEPFIDLQTPLPRARAHAHQVPLHDGFLYSVGGRNFGQNSVSEVYVGFLAF